MREYTVPETPEQNGVAERYNRTVVETARSLLIESKLPKSYWLRAVDTAAYVRNLVKKDKTDKSPYEKFWAREPKTGHLKVFGCLAYVKNRKREKSKFDPNARKHVFLGYDSNSFAYLLQDIETRKLTRARNVVFHERKVVGFTNDPKEAENDLLFDVTFEDQNEVEDSQNVVKIETKEEGPEIVIKPEVLVDDESSSSSETENQIELTRSSTINPEYEVGPDNQVESTRNLTLTPESQAPPIPPRKSIGPSPPRPSKIPVLQERSQKPSDVQQTSQVVKPKMKVPSKLDMAKQLVKIGLPSSTDKCIERWWEYRDMQDTRKEAKELKREERSRNPPQRYGQSYSHNSTIFPKEPETYKQAISSSEKENWLQAMQEELNSLSETNTWTLVECPKDKNVIPGKWVYKVKTKADGSLEKYKARYVAKGFKQIEGTEYSETFAPTSKPETFRFILSLAAKENFVLRQMDVKSAYLHPEIKEEIYLEQPSGFEKMDPTGKSLFADWINQSTAWSKLQKTGTKNWRTSFFSKTLCVVKMTTAFSAKMKRTKNFSF